MAVKSYGPRSTLAYQRSTRNRTGSSSTGRNMGRSKGAIGSPIPEGAAWARIRLRRP